MSSNRPIWSLSLSERRYLLWGLLFTLPGIIGLLMFTLYPVLASLYYSFCTYSVLRPPHFVGAANYSALFHDNQLAVALKNTLLFAVLSVPLGIVVAFLLATLLNQQVRAMPLFRTLFYLPSVVPGVASAVLWLWILNPQFGLLNTALAAIGIHGPGWLADPAWAKPALALMSVWGVGGWMVIFLAGLQDVPVELQEAARLDGAGTFATWRNVTLPFMSPHLLFAAVMGLIGVSSFFSQPMVMTGGGPADSTLFFAQYLFANAFQYFKMGYACAMAWTVGVVLMFLTWLMFRSSARHIYYGGD